MVEIIQAYISSILYGLQIAGGKIMYLQLNSGSIKR